MGILQTYPRGYLGYLNQKIGGNAPQSVADELVPMVDATPFYREFAVISSGVLGLTMPGSAVIATVPSTQRWLIFNVGVTVSMSAAGTLVGSILLSVGNATLLLTDYQKQIIQLGDVPTNRSYSWNNVHGMMLDPGDSLTFDLGPGSLSTSNVDLGFGLRYVPCPI